jgi:hypothetical protein
VRASQGFGVLVDADLLPGHKDPAFALQQGPRVTLKDRMHMALPMGLGMEGGADSGDGEGRDE